jgi:mono/diheme cytochrome c family protein
LQIVLCVAAVMIAFVAGALVFAEFAFQRKLHRVVAFEARPVAAATDAAALARGKYLFNSRGCAECHGADGGGKVMFDSDGLYVQTPDISSSPDSVVAHYSDLDWVNVIRHGVKPDNRPLFIMSSEDFARYTDADIAALIGYARSLPAVAGTPAGLKIPLEVRLQYVLGIVRDAAEKIDHSLPPPQPAATDDLPGQGAYVANACTGCHNESLSGGPIAGAPSEWPPAANLTPGQGSVMPQYPSEDAFAAMFRTGKRPDGSPVSDVMPFGELREFSEDDVKALYAYLKTLPPRKPETHAESE